MRKRIQTLLVMIGVLAAFGLVACGDDDDGGSGSDGGGSGDFVADAQAICEEADSASTEISASAPANEEEGLAQIDEYGNLLTEFRDDINGLDAQTPEQEAFVAELDSQLGIVIPAFDDLKDATENQDAEAAQAANDKLAQLDSDKIETLAKAAGLESCNAG